jgi:hypothetical protein
MYLDLMVRVCPCQALSFFRFVMLRYARSALSATLCHAPIRNTPRTRPKPVSRHCAHVGTNDPTAYSLASTIAMPTMPDCGIESTYIVHTWRLCYAMYANVCICSTMAWFLSSIMAWYLYSMLACAIVTLGTLLECEGMGHTPPGMLGWPTPPLFLCKADRWVSVARGTTKSKKGFPQGLDILSRLRYNTTRRPTLRGIGAAFHIAGRPPAALSSGSPLQWVPRRP